MIPNNKITKINLTLTSVTLCVLHLYTLFQLIFPTDLSGRYCYYKHHLRDMETEA